MGKDAFQFKLMCLGIFSSKREKAYISLRKTLFFLSPVALVVKQ